MLHAAKALLRQKDLHYRKHSSVHSAYGEHFAKTFILDPKYHRWILAAFNTRIKGDYDIEPDIDIAAAIKITDHAREFLEAARTYLELQG